MSLHEWSGLISVTHCQVAHQGISNNSRQRNRSGKGQKGYFEDSSRQHKKLERRWRSQEGREKHSAEAVVHNPMSNSSGILPCLAVKDGFAPLPGNEIENNAAKHRT